ncbi:MAG: DnaJ domain-containing protein [bacterium]|nr:DnaJ domain-containing protein [bacterium]
MNSTPALEHERALIVAQQALAAGSGILSCVGGKLKRVFCFENGSLIFAASNVIEEQLEEYLVKRKVISRGQRVVAQKEAEEAGQKLLSYLTSKGIVKTDDMKRAQTDHFRDLLFQSLLRPDIELTFDRGRPDLTGQIATEVSAFDLILDYTAAYPENLDDVRTRIGPPDMRPAKVERAARLVDDRPLPATVEHVLRSSDGDTELGEIVEQSPESAPDTLRAAYALLLLGVIEPAKAAKDEALSELAQDKASREETVARLNNAMGADHYAILGVEQTASADDVREAYYVLARRFHPDRFRAGALQDLLPRVESYFTQVTEAYNTLHDAERREVYNEELAGFKSEADKKQEAEQDLTSLARQNYAQAKVLINKRRKNEAVVFLENAIEQDDTKPLYFLELGTVLLQNPRRRPDAERHLKRALELEPTNPKGYAGLGELYARAKKKAEAAEMYRQALNWDPDNPEYEEALKAVTGGGRKKGLFG